MWSSGRRVLQEVLRQPAVRSFSLSPAQNTVVVERWWQVSLSKVGSPPRLHPRRHRIYKLVEDTKHAPKEKMELILTQTVPKLGGRGDTVFVKKSVGRNKLLPQGLAVYPSPENKQMFAEEIRLLREGNSEERMQTRTGQLTVELLKSSHLKIKKMPVDQFQLTKQVICRQFQKKGVVVPPHALSFPFESVQDLGDYWCEVTVNGIDTVRIPISLEPYEDPSASYQQQLKKQKRQQKEVSDAAAAAVEVSDAAAAAVEVSDAAAVEVSDAAAAAVEVSDAAAVEVSDAAAVEVSDAAAAAVEVSDAAAAAVEVSDAAAVEVSDAAAVEVSDAAAAAVEVSDAAAVEVSDAAAVEVSDAAAAAVEVSDSKAETGAGNNAVSQVCEAAGEEKAATPQTSQDTTAPPSDSPKKD